MKKIIQVVGHCNFLLLLLVVLFYEIGASHLFFAVGFNILA